MSAIKKAIDRKAIASGHAVQSALEARAAGVLRYINLNTVKKHDGTIVVNNRNGEVALVDEGGRERERYSRVMLNAAVVVAPRYRPRAATGKRTQRLRLCFGRPPSSRRRRTAKIGEATLRRWLKEPERRVCRA